MNSDEGLSRRFFVRAVGAGALVTAFDGTSQAWASAGGESGLDRVPHLDGRLLTGAADLAAFEDDFGHLVHRTPLAVLEPGSVADVARLIEFCGPRRIPVAARGQGHQTDGQAQVSGGLVIDMSPLNAITVDPVAKTATAGAGAVWSAVLTASLAHGLTPPVFTDYVELSIGGTLSAGGLGGAAHHHGAQVDNVVELEVVTGTGEIVGCSRTRNADLFHAALAGLGQVGVITRATLALVHAPASARKYTLGYPTVAAMTAAQRRAVRDGRFGWLEGSMSALPGGGWSYALEGTAYYDGAPPDDNALIGDLGYEGAPQIDNFTYADYVNDLAPLVVFLKSTGEWYDPHVWLDLFLPDADTDAYVTSVMDSLTAADIGASGVVLLYPVPTAKLRTPLLRVPDSELMFLFSVLRTAAPDAGAVSAASMVEGNRELYLEAQAFGGTQYPVGTIPMTGHDWRVQYGDQWQRFSAAKHRFDPHAILAPGQGIFGPAD
jgi:FAD/FMN-containing dehydrogenase